MKESVWDYPRPPRVEPSGKRIRIYFDGILLADSTATLRVLETSHPPTYYIPRSDIITDRLESHPKRTYCEFKGEAHYYTVTGSGPPAEAAAWEYPSPRRGYEALKDHLAFYAAAMDECYVGEELVDPQEGSFYGGWITSEVEGPFKGGAGTWGW
ncbi:MAG: DUF427 domain-containing protein [Alkalispirochaetaceae bacterium]